MSRIERWAATAGHVRGEEGGETVSERVEELEMALRAANRMIDVVTAERDQVLAERDQTRAQVARLRAAMSTARAVLMDYDKRPDDCCIEADELLVAALADTPPAVPDARDAVINRLKKVVIDQLFDMHHPSMRPCGTCEEARKVLDFDVRLGCGFKGVGMTDYNAAVAALAAREQGEDK